jgi:chromate reductase, NAD(P)H dehydrogenase (quinone)
MAKKLKILAFAGSLREHSFSKRVVKTAMKGAENAGAEVTYIDLRDFPMPLYNEDEHKQNGFDANALKLQRVIAEHDGFLICSPEYNGSLPGGLKNAIDWTSRTSDEFKMYGAFRGKWAAMMTASPGAFGGLRCLGHLRGVLTIMQINVLPTEIAVGKVHEMFDGDGEEMTDEKMKGILENLGASLVEIVRKTRGEDEAASK